LKKDKFFLLTIVTAFFVYVITAFNSHGYYHADEHYQIIEFAAHKLGKVTPDQMAWEFNARLRPTLQPIVALGIIKFLLILNITDPYIQVCVLRILTAVLSLLVISVFVKNTSSYFINKWQNRSYFLLSFFLWFIPYISVRFSSETYSGLFFILALVTFIRHKESHKNTVLIGLLMGLSFLFRFQMAFAAFGFGLWLLFVNKSNWHDIIKLSLGFLLMVGVGILIDSWFYGEFVFSPWNYFYENVVNDVASTFGGKPWYYYPGKMVVYPSIFIGIPLFLSFVIVLVLNYKNLFLWCIIPFVIVHTLIPHKEERFMFPLIYMFPFVMMSAYKYLNDYLENKKYMRLINWILVVFFLVVNPIGIIALSSKSAGIGRMEITKWINDNVVDKDFNIIHIYRGNPYNPWRGLPATFYMNDNYHDYEIDSLAQLHDSILVSGAVNFLALRAEEVTSREAQQIMTQQKFEFVKSSVPQWIIKLNYYFSIYDNKNVLLLYQHKKTKV